MQPRIVSIGIALAMASTSAAAAPFDAPSPQSLTSAPSPAPAPAATIAANATLRAADAEIVEMDERDVRAQALQARAARLAEDPRITPLQRALATADWRLAETQLDAARADAWASLSRPQLGSAIVNLPLALALLDVHVELRRRLGPVFATRVPGLDTDPGCVGDIVADRLVYAYGTEATGPVGAESDETLAALAAFARQVACLGSDQLGQLDAALARSFADTARRMAALGHGSLGPAFARLVAPLELVMLDARKHRGRRAYAWRWFRVFGEPLRQAVEAGGWATQELMVWDRRSGFLLGLPACAPGMPAPDCVDLATLLASVEDARALGLGGCALAGMISRGVESLDGADRYVCPVSACEPSETLKTGSEIAGASLATPGGWALPAVEDGSSTALVADLRDASMLATRGAPASVDPLAGELAALWGSAVGAGDLPSMRALCAAGEDLQGPNFDASSCFEELPDADVHDPFASHLACLEEALGSDEPVLGGELQGVPNGPHCGIVDGDDETPDPAGAGATGEPKNDPEPSESPDPHAHDDCGASGLPCVIKGDPQAGSAPPPEARQLEQGDTQIVANGSGEAEIRELLDPESGELVKVIVTVEGMSTEQARALIEEEIYGEDGSMKDWAFTEKEEALEVALAEAAEHEADGECDGECTGIGELVPYTPSGGGHCPDGTCGGNNCSGLGEQVSDAMECTMTLLDDLAEASGRPVGDPLDPPDIVSNWSPDSNHGVEVDTGICLGGATHTRPPAICGLVLCADGMLASPVGDGCGCGDGTPRVRVEDVCIEARCIDGSVPGPDCRCGDWQEVPLPEGPGVTRSGPDAPITLGETCGPELEAGLGSGASGSTLPLGSLEPRHF